MRIRLSVSLTSILVTTLIGVACSSHGVKELTDSSAKSLLEDAAKDDPQRDILLESFRLQLKEGEWTAVDYKQRQSSFTKRLMDAGFVDQRTRTITYPNIAGAYRFEVQPKSSQRFDFDHVLYELYISTQPASNICSVKFHQQTWYATGQPAQESSGVAEGTLGEDNTLSIKYPYGTMLGSPSVLRIKSDGTNTRLIVGPVWIKSAGDVVLTGSSNGGEISVLQYSYSASTKMKEFVRTVSGREFLYLGRIAIDSIDKLQLESDVSAVATFGYHVDPTKLGQVINPRTQPPTSGASGLVRFGKKPDGTWFVAKHSYDSSTPFLF